MTSSSNRIFHERTPARCLLASALIAGTLLGAAQSAQAGNRMLASMANSNAEFVTWRQGFEHDTAGWYDAATPGPLGWCGAIEQVKSRGREGGAVPAPSAGTGYGSVSTGWCNEFWTAMGVPGGAPYALEERWVNVEVVPEILEIDLSVLSANEWLVRKTTENGSIIDTSVPMPVPLT